MPPLQSSPSHSSPSQDSPQTSPYHASEIIPRHRHCRNPIIWQRISLFVTHEKLWQFQCLMQRNKNLFPQPISNPRSIMCLLNPLILLVTLSRKNPPHNPFALRFVVWRINRWTPFRCETNLKNLPMTPKLQIRFQKLSKPITDTIKKETIIWVIVIPIQSNFSLKNLPLFPQSSSFLLRNLLHFLQYSFLLHLFLLVKIHMYISLRSLLFVPGLLCEFTNLRAKEKPIENLRQVLEVTKICQGLEIESQGFSVRFVKPKRRGVRLHL